MAFKRFDLFLRDVDSKLPLIENGNSGPWGGGDSACPTRSPYCERRLDSVALGASPLTRDRSLHFAS